MKLFNEFRETIFYKNDSTLKDQITALNKLLEKYPNNQELTKQLTLCQLGLKGEEEIEFELKNSNIGMYVLHDINLEYEDLKAQIDYIVITPAKTYFIECKNLTGNITVSSTGEFSRQWNYNGHKIQEGIYSPLRQAQRHIEVYKKIRFTKNKDLLSKINYNYIDNYHVPLVVMANPKNILNIENAPEEVKNKIVRSDNLIKYLQDDISKEDYLLSQKAMEKKANDLLNNYNKPININYEEYYMKYINNDLKQKLTQFRKQRSKEMNIPAYHVFTNDELEQLLTYMPRSLEELKDHNILTPIKIKTHGEEIIKVLNER